MWVWKLGRKTGLEVEHEAPAWILLNLWVWIRGPGRVCRVRRDAV